MNPWTKTTSAITWWCSGILDIWNLIRVCKSILHMRTNKRWHPCIRYCHSLLCLHHSKLRRAQSLLSSPVIPSWLRGFGIWRWNQSLWVRFPTGPLERRTSLSGFGPAAHSLSFPRRREGKNTFLYLENPWKGSPLVRIDLTGQDDDDEHSQWRTILGGTIKTHLEGHSCSPIV